MMELQLPDGVFSDLTIMKQWMKEKTGVQSDFVVDGNALIWNKQGTAGKTLFLFRLLPSAVIVKNVEKETAEVLPLGDTKLEKIADTICENGILRLESESAKEGVLKPFTKAVVGEIYHVTPNTICKGDMLYGTQLGSLIQLELAALCIKNMIKNNVAVTVAVVNETVSGAEGVLRVIERTRPETFVVCTTAVAEKEFSVGQGPGIGIKDGSWVADREVWSKLLDASPDAQRFIGTTGGVLAKCYLAAKAKALAGIYLPVAMMGTRVEEIHWRDFEKTQNLLLKCIDLL